MTDEEIKKREIESALAAIPVGDFLETSKDLLAVLGYRSQRTMKLSGTAEGFIQTFPAENKNTKTEQEFRNNAKSVELVFQVTSDEIADSQPNLFESRAFDEGLIKSFVFFTVELKDKGYPRSKYAQFTREINKRLSLATVVLFRVERCLTIAFVGRQPNQRDVAKDVLQKVTLIKDIRLDNPYRAHLDILSELSLAACAKWMKANNQPKNFDGLLAAWLARLDTEELNKQFYRQLFHWFEWAVIEGKFPTNENRTLKPEEHVIRLITRLLFVWFIKEKGLVADELFNKIGVQDLLKADDFDTGDSYYRAVLQNLFFATLNTEIEKRRFSKRTNTDHRNFSRYRYKEQIRDSDQLLKLFEQTPFINGGLFDCLDSEKATGTGGYRIDCFSDEHYKTLSLPNRLFFDEARGLFPLLDHYKFTVEENTPIEQEVALDPELLGKVFENLLAAYNPETGATARKQTGSYYTPRPIVDYMVEEALVTTLTGQVPPTDGDAKFWEERLRYLLDYAQAFDDASEWFDSREADAVVRAISELKILDPAVGSGAFPMGALHKLTLALRRLDPDNRRWEALQKERAAQRAADAFDTEDDQTRREELLEINETFKRYRDSDFGRKLYLIQNSIFGVDIQSVACQIAKLRFFISLAIEQEPDATQENLGVKPLPNLETRFIAANTLIGLEGERTLTSPKARNLERELADNRERYFHATTRRQKLGCKRRDEVLRGKLAAELRHIGMPADDADKIARWDLYDQNASADFFDPEWMFGLTDGFDVVIGNPPYVRQEKIKGLKPALQQRYDCYTGTADLYVYFYERGFQMLRGDGVLTYISSNKYFRSAYGRKLRDFLARQATLSQLIDFGDAPVFTSIAYPSIITASKTHAQGNHLRALNWEPGPSIDEFGTVFRTQGFTMPQNALTADGWRLTSPAVLNLLEKLHTVGKPLNEYVNGRIYRGIVTGLNEAFIVDRATRDTLIAEHPSSSEVLKPFLRGRDVKRWQVESSNLYLCYIGWELPIKKYPAIYAHLKKFENRLKARPEVKQGRMPWYALSRYASDYWQEFEQPQIVWGNLAQYPKFAFASAGFYLSAPATMMVADSEYLLGIMNSRITRYWVSQSAAERQGGFLEFKPMYISPIAIPDPPENEGISDRVSQILAAKDVNPAADVSDLENEIDQIIYLLYGLTDEEIAIVEGAENV